MNEICFPPQPLYQEVNEKDGLRSFKHQDRQVQGRYSIYSM